MWIVTTKDRVTQKDTIPSVAGREIPEEPLTVLIIPSKIIYFGGFYFSRQFSKPGIDSKTVGDRNLNPFIIYVEMSGALIFLRIL